MDLGGGPASGPLGWTAGAVVFDWDGTAVTDRAAPADAVRDRVERLSAIGVHTAVVSGTHLANVDGQLAARPPGPGRLLLALNRGSELFEVGPAGPVLLADVPETADVRRRLDGTAHELAELLRGHGLAAEVVGHRLNRCKVDLVPAPAWSDPPKTRLRELVAEVTARLSAAGLGSLADVADLAHDVAARHGLPQARISSDAKHVEVGVTDKGDAMRAVLARLDALGVGPGLVLLVGDEFGDLAGVPGSDARMLLGCRPGVSAVSVGVEPDGVPDGVLHVPGGPVAFLRLLDEQLARAADLRVPQVCHDPRWTWVERGVDPARQRVVESLFTLGSGGIGWRGSVEETADVGEPLVSAAGVWAGPAEDDGLLEGPDLADIRLTHPVEGDVRTLDLRTGVLHREEVRTERPLRSARFASAVECGVFAMRVEAASNRLLAPEDADADRDVWSAVVADVGGIGSLSHEQRAVTDETTSVQRLVCVDAPAHRSPSPGVAGTRLARATATGFERLLAGQREAWAARWQRVGVSIPGDPRLELRLRLALFHLWNLSGRRGDLAVGARSVTGTGYYGHVFWDADAFVLPALVTIDPPSAAAMLRYRLRRLGAARARARAAGRSGARFPWESGREGFDVTPPTGYIGGEEVDILTGALEEHITADVAWAVRHHAEWTRTAPVHTTPERVLLRDTARYWASRAVRGDDGAAHLLDVIGPDEYHEHVDDNAFTNVMARWNLRHALRHAPARPAERTRWAELADALVDGHDVRTGLYEQFRGYFDLAPILVRDVGTPPVAADVLLGRDGVARSQVIKQPDVLMLHHLVPDEVAPATLGPCLDFYGPRTAHGSSLSPAVMAHLNARAHRADTAHELLDLALAIDPDDVGGTTAAGFHVAAAAGAWRAVVGGFLGAQVTEGRLHLDPVLPGAWPEAEVRFACLGTDVRVAVDRHVVTVDAAGPLTVRLAAGCGLTGRAGGGVDLERGRS